MDNTTAEKSIAKVILCIDSDVSNLEEWVSKSEQKLQGFATVEVLRRDSESNKEECEVSKTFALYKELARRVKESPSNLGIVIASSGLEPSLILNKVNGIRAGLVSTYYLAEMTRRHNDANVMIIGTDHTGLKKALEFLPPFASNHLDIGPGKYHESRVIKLNEIEQAQATHKDSVQV